MGKASAQSIDFSGVKERGNFNPKQVAEGDYAAVITAVEDTKAKSDDGFMYVFTFKLKKYSQHSYPYYCKLTENQLWKLRNLLVAAGMNIPKGKAKVDPNKVVGREVGVTMADDEHEGKMKSTIEAVFPVSEIGDTGPEDTDENTDDASGDEVEGLDDGMDEPTPKAKKKKDKGGDKADKKKKKKDKENVEELDLGEV